MRIETSQQIAASVDGTFGSVFKFAAASALVMVVTIFGAGKAAAGTSDVNVVNTPTVNVGNTPSVSVANTPNVNVANTPAVSISGTPTVNANATVTAPGPLTNVGRLASQQVTIQAGAGTCTGPNWLQINPDGSGSCFDMSNHPGQVLIITDVAWFSLGTAGNTCFANLILPLHNSSIVMSSSTAAADGFVGKTEHLTTGVSVTVNPAIASDCQLEAYLMHGYFVPNQ